MSYGARSLSETEIDELARLYWEQCSRIELAAHFHTVHQQVDRIVAQRFGHRRFMRWTSCSHCGERMHIGKHQNHQLYCSTSCRQRAYYVRRKEHTP